VCAPNFRGGARPTSGGGAIARKAPRAPCGAASAFMLCFVMIVFVSDAEKHRPQNVAVQVINDTVRNFFLNFDFILILLSLCSGML